MPVILIPLSYILCDLFNVSFVVQYLYFLLKSSLLVGYFFCMFFNVCMPCLFLTCVSQGLTVSCMQLVLPINIW